ncbi:hypothetical protein FALBO_291 [Fusarium albosuccineum]|uniref:Uncharacterized protein n=1 Tax=Fusarium albosuccineum TaxID=1237068 RepID=A0A8H4PEM3_9HYPO|nr:hypothetical protein FALBO_291 [Fusarium albosuccineum]
MLSLYWIFLEPIFCNVGNLGFFSWGVYAAFKYRKIGHSCMTDDDKPKENEMGFGQIVALVLLIAPAINTADLWWIRSKKDFLGAVRTQSPKLSFRCEVSVPM